MRRASLRVRLSIAFVAVAALAVGLATLLSTRGLEPRLTDAAEARIARSADRLAADAVARYRREGRWTEAAASDLEHVGLTTGLRLAIIRIDGRPVRTADSARMLNAALHAPGATSRPVLVGGRRVGTLHAAPVGGGLLSPADVNLRDSLDRLHMIAGAIAVAIALIAALLLAQTISAPLRRIRSTAQRMERGDLDAATEPSGDAEVRAVGHALNRLAETLQHEDRLRRENVADLAHELRTPVSGLLSRIEAAQDGVLPDEANLEAMHGEALRLRRLLDDLDRLAAAERPGLLLEKRAVDLAAVAGSEADQIAASFAEKDVALERKLVSTEIEGDPDRLGQIVANLLSNALRYTEAGGRVHLRVGSEEDGGAVLEVADSGIGIDPEDLKHIFKRFWRADKSRSRATGGTGIGLAIVRELVIAHEGRIDVESAPGRGSRFRVSFPASSKADHENGRPSSHQLQTRVRS